MVREIAGHSDIEATTCPVAGGGRWHTSAVAVAGDQERRALLRRGFALEYATLAWNVAGIVVLATAAVSARSVALAGFALSVRPWPVKAGGG